MYLRSSTVSTALPRFLSFFSDVSTRSVQAGSSTASVVMAWIMVRALDILHRFVVVAAARRTTSGKVGNCIRDVDFFTLK
jgi:hypothetical protein